MHAPFLDQGQEAWLRYRPLPESFRAIAGAFLGPVRVAEEATWGRESPILLSIVAEWERARTAFIGGRDADDMLPVTLRHDPAVTAEHFAIAVNPSAGVSITAGGPAGVLYGIFRLIRLVQTHHPADSWNVQDGPRVRRRIIDHWDNVFPVVDIERGYGGESIWRWTELPDTVAPSYTDYARMLASIGINGLVVNNVNASRPQVGGYRLVTDDWIPKLAALAEVFRAWGIRIGVSISYNAPVLTGELDTSDPREKRVQAWWHERTAALYDAIPDLLGYLVKADSEGQPGPADFDLDHAEGSRLLANCLAGFGGSLFWRAFVYNTEDTTVDLMAQPYRQFKPLDGRFGPNVLLQVKNGPRDFQVREPLHPLIGALEKTPIALELQTTQEYLGHDTHLVFLPTQWQEALGQPTMTGASAAEFLCRQQNSALVGVSNVNDSPCWTSHLFAQANLYGFGRLAWDPQTDAKTIGDEWARMTFDNSVQGVDTVTRLLGESYHTFEGYIAPYCLGQCYNAAGTWDADHFDPEPWRNNGSRWFHADKHGIGIDRTYTSETGYLGQYPPSLQRLFGDPATCPADYLLWFHHLPWTHRMPSGKTLVQTLYDRYFEAAELVDDWLAQWKRLSGTVDCVRFTHVLERLQRQRYHARLWARYMTSYFYSLNGIADEQGRVY